MGYAKLDDRLPHHKKVRALPPTLARACYGLYVASIQFCQHYETDGVIRKADLHLLLPGASVPPRKEISALVEVRLWDEVSPILWAVHDYLEHNASAAERKAKGRFAANARWSAHRTAQGNASSKASSNASPLHSSPLHSTPLRSSTDAEGFSAMVEQESQESRDAFQRLIAGVSERIGFKLGPDP